MNVSTTISNIENFFFITGLSNDVSKAAQSPTTKDYSSVVQDFSFAFDLGLFCFHAINIWGYYLPNAPYSVTKVH